MLSHQYIKRLKDNCYIYIYIYIYIKLKTHSFIQKKKNYTNNNNNNTILENTLFNFLTSSSTNTL
ncbi:MAG: hypothetical protein MCS20_01340, partial [Candidatus Phytoplasma mali]|nr:hypothetical protein [Candidatus Phytoplasma australiense]MCG7202042.1 hypothetical protein [Candidatus Phytoplasma mali]